ncbi:hypothetical protein [Bacillus sp. P14.5]|uniref:hypothetical protein n=1 Tax=Bacillus sp. P14.5 TaxID=1983400 RepID=UPI000DEA1CB2|nr:hypothetical protein [Bacillus sp. P14.5]
MKLLKSKALATSAAITHPEVRSVTLNPALLPKGMADPNKSCDNITNCFTNYDDLTGTLTALSFDSGIPEK